MVQDPQSHRIGATTQLGPALGGICVCGFGFFDELKSVKKFDDLERGEQIDAELAPDHVVWIDEHVFDDGDAVERVEQPVIATNDHLEGRAEVDVRALADHFDCA